jgi:hypothetical protein
MAGFPARLKDTNGFALAIAVFALVLLAAIVAAGYFSATQETQIGRGMRSLTTSIYAGEAGIYEVLQNWDATVYVDLQPGDSQTVGPVDLEGGGGYQANVIRVGQAADSVKRYFYVEAVGNTPLPTLGARRQAMVVRASYPNICCDAALKVNGDDLDFAVSGFDQKIDGHDYRPSAWGAICDAFPITDTTGVIIPDTMRINRRELIDGVPPIVQDPSLVEGQIFFDGYTWADLAALADHSFTGNKTFVGSSKSVVNGECDREDPNNLGAPDDPGHACFNYFPIIHVGNSLVFSIGAVQGIFLVEGDVSVIGPVTVYGIILLKDDLFVSLPATVYGYGWVGDDANFAGFRPDWFLSTCAAKRAVLYSNITRPVPVAQRAWTELF